MPPLFHDVQNVQPYVRQSIQMKILFVLSQRENLGNLPRLLEVAKNDFVESFKWFQDFLWTYQNSPQIPRQNIYHKGLVKFWTCFVNGVFNWQFLGKWCFPWKKPYLVIFVKFQLISRHQVKSAIINFRYCRELRQGRWNFGSFKNDFERLKSFSFQWKKAYSVICGKLQS